MNILEKLGITPGPWRHVGVNGGWDGIKSDKTGDNICYLIFNNPTNADLIAAAPEMLEALIQILITLDYLEEENDKTNMFSSRFDHIHFEEAIEKATGRTWKEIKEALNNV